MHAYSYDYAIVGGDRRQAYLAEILASEHNAICCYALCQPPARYADRIKIVSSPEAAIHASARVICPIPLSRDGSCLNQNVMKGNLSLGQLLSFFRSGQLLFAGCIPEEFSCAAAKAGVLTFDFMKDAALSRFNSIATAEGMLCEAIKMSPLNLHQSRCAVLGYGICGQTLTDKLCRLFCRVTVATDPAGERAQAAVFSEETMDLRMFLARIGSFDFIFNTIPSLILTKEALARTKPGATILDIASAPGGVDFAAAKELSVNAAACPSLPGKYAPLSSARAIRNSIQKLERSLS